MVHIHFFPISPKTPLLHQSRVFSARSVRETWILLPTEPLPAAGGRACIASAGQTDCDRADLDCTCGPEKKHRLVKAIICWMGESICSGASVGRRACPAHSVYCRRHSSVEVVAMLEFFFFSPFHSRRVVVSRPLKIAQGF